MGHARVQPPGKVRWADYPFLPGWHLDEGAMFKRSSFLLVLLMAGALAAGLAGYRVWHGPLLGPDTYETEHTEYHPPQADPDDALVDDRLEDKKPLTFDPALVDRRPLDHRNGYLLNASAAVIRLDVPPVKPDVESELLTLFPSYAACSLPTPDAPKRCKSGSEGGGWKRAVAGQHLAGYLPY
jgi:hypothetical protein